MMMMIAIIKCNISIYNCHCCCYCMMCVYGRLHFIKTDYEMNICVWINHHHHLFWILMKMMMIWKIHWKIELLFLMIKMMIFYPFFSSLQVTFFIQYRYSSHLKKNISLRMKMMTLYSHWKWMNENPMINVDIPIKRGIQVKIKLIVIFFYNDDDDYEDFLSFFWISAFERGIELLNKENTALYLYWMIHYDAQNRWVIILAICFRVKIILV